MRHFSAFLSRLLPMQMLLSTLLVITLFFTSALPAMAAQNTSDKGEAQLDKITQRTEDAAVTPAMLLNPIDKDTKEGPNEIQGTADRDKMISSDDTELPVIKQVREALQN